MKKRVVVAMSGGVDSSVTAALLKREGYEVIGITMQIWPSNLSPGKDEASEARRPKLAEEAERFGGCCGLSAVEDAKRVAERLNIPHYVLNFRDVFEKKVIANFCEEYKEGRTPNPCIRCNQYIKFGVLLSKAKELDAEYIATGHYARIEYDKKRRRYFLRKGIDPKKDQSYVLYIMTQEQLKHTLMPLGTLTKEKVREIARELNLPVASKPESQEICFIPNTDYHGFLRTRIGTDSLEEGLIVNKKGRVLGRHKGIAFYTIGQRRGLGIATDKPLYVIAVDKDKNVLVVGSEKETLKDKLIAEDVNWITLDKLKEPIRIKAKIRYRHREAAARVTPLIGNRVEVRFRRPQRAITPGQAVVFYDKDLLIGGGRIEKR
ncbi:MAG TPA: tRNA 2-thiouridine(34) synthase MnmA [bacterium]|nr:tRNA 2-thiouridine(34) synthase MnmA [bacterium]